jgi:ribonuclease P protein component
MLAADHRLRSSQDFQRITHEGRRSRHATVVVYLTAGIHPQSRVGLIVGKATGNAVVRHRISRRLRAIMAPHVTAPYPIVDVVVRALPAAATATTTELNADIAAALRRLAPT